MEVILIPPVHSICSCIHLMHLLVPLLQVDLREPLPKIALAHRTLHSGWKRASFDGGCSTHN
jgi:hypothetical protein